MAEPAKRFTDPNIGLSRIYTRTGDDGSTGLVGGARIPKDDVRIEAYGTVDELNAWIGLARAAALDSGPAVAPMAATLLRVQHQLFNLGSQLSTLGELKPNQPRVTPAEVAWLESEMDAVTPRLPPLRSFVLPGGARLNALLHLARTVCRRAERIAVALRRSGGCGHIEVHYLNRLSDALFVWSREASHLLGPAETLWEPNRA
ncbi:MAG: cob(I)yrinic acid a,c-diamide adenosyltransferase [Candidatus Thermoplasmatota archaeon]